jgi:hypothetical protein
MLAGAWLASIHPAVGGETSPLQAGVATVDITPNARLPMWGYSDRTAPAEGVLDALRAKILVLVHGNRRVAIVTLDLGRTPEQADLAALAQTTAKRSQVSDLFVTASHTHQAPNLEQYGDEPNPYVQELLLKLATGIADAAAALQPVTLAIARGDADLAHNRRKILPDGRVAMQWRNVEREPTAPIDREFTVVRLDRADGTPLAMLVHYACHPVVLGGDHLQYSADYVGAMRDLVEAELETTCLFLQGGCGDINPYVDKTPVSQGGIEAMREMGRSLGTAVIAASVQAQPQTGPPAIEFVEENIEARVRWDLNDPQVRSVLSSVYGRRFDKYLAPRLSAGKISLPLTMLLVNESLALVGMPGEIFVQFQLDLKRLAPVPHTLLVGYTNGYHAYFPTIRDAALGGYGGKTATYVDVGTGEMLRDQALRTLYQRIGILPDRPLPQDFKLLEWNDIREQRAGE